MNFNNKSPEIRKFEKFIVKYTFGFIKFMKDTGKFYKSRKLDY